ncbi:MAG: PD-(D/E)XK nuclease family protein [Paludibacteraceae bacterium]|nr:PD-(D/E)XK nuclease family protein [Paludibacteraceae bacterium]
MVPFLKLVADDLKAKYNDLSQLTIVFPNNRARLFFNNFLVGNAEQPIWSPSYTTIQDLFANSSSLQVADDIKLICELYRVYVKHIDWRKLEVEPEAMDDFYFWGEVLLRDFEDVDNNLVDAEQLFRNITELTALEDDVVAILTEEQKEALRHFFAHFSEKNDSIIKRKFAALWNALWPIYCEYRDNLTNQGIAYGGMLHRSVAENIDINLFPSEKYVFVGFNVLNQSEVTLFKHLDKAGKALFYWDADEFYMNMPNIQHEAATFMRQNLENFKNSLDKSDLNEFNTTPKEFTIISSSTNNAQAKYLSSYLQKRKTLGDKDSDTAVVLCDETLLLSTLHAVPDCVEALNITMGLPLIQTPVYALVKALLDMRSFIDMLGPRSTSIPLRYVKDALSNPYVQIAFDGAPELFDEIAQNNIYFPKVEMLVGQSSDLAILFSFLKSNQENTLTLLTWLVDVIKKVATFYQKDNDHSDHSANSLYDPLYKEALYRTYTILNRVISLVKSKDLEVTVQTICKLLDRMLSAASVPFSGEPVKGMQIMGFLETRNLDFKNVIMLSVNEGVLPKGSGDSSFIPYSLRKGFGMTTLDQKNSLYAYYFYRLLQRVENATFLYSSATSGGSKGQMSRFLMQLMVETQGNVKLHMRDLRSEIQVYTPPTFEVEKTQEMVDILLKIYDKNHGGKSLLSPSMLNKYINCPLQFYFSYVMGLKEPEELDDTIDQRIFGLIFHKVFENIYADYMNRVVEPHVIKEWLEPSNEPMLEKYVDDAFRSEYFHDNSIQYTGQQLLLKMTILSYVRNGLIMDMKLAPFTIVGREKEERFAIEVDGMSFDLGGYIDRLQRVGNTYQIIDYKTGALPKNFVFSDGFSQLFNPTDSNRKYWGYAMQVWIYSYICHKETGDPAVPYLMFVRSKDGLRPSSNSKDLLELNSGNSGEICGEIEENLITLIREIFSKEQPFKRSSNAHSCSFCSFIEICQGKKSS